MARQEEQPLVLKRVRKSKPAAHHGGAWKVAYADFVTAMMAFFLLMWLLNATSEEQRHGLADYFDPTLPIARDSAGGTGVLSGDTIFAKGRLAGTEERGAKPRPGEKRVPGPESTRPAPMRGADEATAETSGGPADRARGVQRRDEAALRRDLAEKLDRAEDPRLRQHFRLRETPEGLVIEMVDLSHEPLFETGSARPSPVLGLLLGILAPILAPTLNDIAVTGHTDARPYAGDGSYSNWELSADRANTARRILTRSGLGPGRITRVSGYADTRPVEPDAMSPLNRRIAVVLLRPGLR